MSGSTTDFTIEFDFRGQRYNDATAGLKAFAARTGKSLDVAPRLHRCGCPVCPHPGGRRDDLSEGRQVSSHTAAGGARRQRRATQARSRSWSNTFVAKSKAGNLLTFQKQGKSVTPLYVLKTSVYIPPRLGMAEGMFTDRAMSQMLKAMKNAP